jgi:hypothetical protein
VARLTRMAVRERLALVTVTATPPIVRGLDRFSRPGSWTRVGSGAVSPTTAGTATATITVPVSGRYGVWLGGAFRRRVDVRIDGKEAGAERNRLSHAGGFEPFGEPTLSRGSHRVTITYGKADLRPGSDGDPFPLGPFVLSRSTSARPLVHVRPRDARALCRKRLDWIELVRSRKRASGDA